MHNKNDTERITVFSGASCGQIALICTRMQNDATSEAKINDTMFFNNVFKNLYYKAMTK